MDSTSIVETRIKRKEEGAIKSNKTMLEEIFVEDK
jgi:hypothetical protein